VAFPRKRTLGYSDEPCHLREHGPSAWCPATCAIGSRPVLPVLSSTLGSPRGFLNTALLACRKSRVHTLRATRSSSDVLSAKVARPILRHTCRVNIAMLSSLLQSLKNGGQVTTHTDLCTQKQGIDQCDFLRVFVSGRTCLRRCRPPLG
jgi:hypothetical protein